jgi:hypothetical protein
LERYTVRRGELRTDINLDPFLLQLLKKDSATALSQQFPSGSCRRQVVGPAKATPGVAAVLRTLI